MSRLAGLTLLLTFSACIQGFAQKNQLDSLIMKVYQDPMNIASERAQEFLQTADFRTPWIREIDFRIRANRFDQVIETYRLRLDIANPIFRNSEKKYHKAFINYQKVRNQVKLNEMLHDQYLQLAGWYYTNQLMQVKSKHHEQKLSLQMALSSSRAQAFGIRDALSLDKDLYDLSLESRDLKEKLSISSNFLVGDQGLDTTIIDGLKMVTIDEMLSVIEESVVLKGISAQELYAEKEYLKQNYNLEKAAQRRELGFIQPEFDPDSDRSIAENLSLQIGLLLPLVNPDKAQINYELWEKQLDQASVDDELKELSNLLQTMYIQAKSIKEQFDLIQEKQQTISNLDEAGFSEDWKLVNDLIDYRNDVSMDQIKVWMQMTEIYFQVLMISGKLAEPPVSNYLLSGAPSIENQAD